MLFPNNYFCHIHEQPGNNMYARIWWKTIFTSPKPVHLQLHQQLLFTSAYCQYIQMRPSLLFDQQLFPLKGYDMGMEPTTSWQKLFALSMTAKIGITAYDHRISVKALKHTLIHTSDTKINRSLPIHFVFLQNLEQPTIHMCDSFFLNNHVLIFFCEKNKIPHVFAKNNRLFGIFRHFSQNHHISEFSTVVFSLI